MLPSRDRLRHRGDFSAAVRGVRCGRSTLVVHLLTRPAGGPGPVLTGPRLGVAVSRAVGPAVVRTRVKRRLRHVAASVWSEVPAGSDVVVRALPRAATATSEELRRDLTSALASAARRAP